MPGSKRKRNQVATACITCRNAKLKCDGKHPTCSRCLDKNHECSYDVTEGMTKRQQQRFDYSVQKQKLDRATALLNYMRDSAESQATETLAHLRCGATCDEEYFRIQDLAPMPADHEVEVELPSGNSLDADMIAQTQRLTTLLTFQQQSSDMGSGILAPPSAECSPGWVENWIRPDSRDWTEDLIALDPRSLNPAEAIHRSSGIPTTNSYAGPHDVQSDPGREYPTWSE